MCNMASFIATRSRVFYSKTCDSHSAILREQGIRDDANHEEFVKVEIVPPGNDYSLPFNKWTFSFDGDVPQWARDIKECIERDCRAALPSWARTKLLSGGEHTIGEGHGIAVIAGKPVITQSGGELWCCGASKPVITQSGGMVRCCGASKPVITQSGGVVWCCDASKPVITQSGGELWCGGASKPVITQSGGVVWCCGASKPVITQSGGVVWCCGAGKPVITQSGGVVRCCGASKPVINKVRQGKRERR